MGAKILISFIVAAIVGVLWLFFAVPTLTAPFPGEWTAIPVTISVLMLTFVALTGGKVVEP